MRWGQDGKESADIDGTTAPVLVLLMRVSSRASLQKPPGPILGYQFRNPDLLEAALTHPSSTDPTQADVRLRYQRLEFLGDAVWSFFISDVLVSLWPTASEGELTMRRARLISAAGLAEIAKAHGIPPLIILSKGEESTGGRARASILSSVLEAVIGAIYLDGGAEDVRRLARGACLGRLGGEEVAPDPKTALQQFTQSRFRLVPRYRLLLRSGPPHAPTFEVEVRVGRSPIGRGSGRSRQEAEHEAALMALASLPVQ